MNLLGPPQLHALRTSNEPSLAHRPSWSMFRRCAASLEPYLGTYHIVWDSESNLDPRGPFVSEIPSADIHDGVLTLAHPHRPTEWPKEPAPAVAASTVVLRLHDSFLGTDHTASKLAPATSISPPASSSSSTDSLLSSSHASGSATKTWTRPTRFWRFDWDPSFPRLGYRSEGMDLTTGAGHTLSFSHLLDDNGCPFAILELRPSGYHQSANQPDYIIVVAKRQRDRYAREGLSEDERQRVGMMDW